MIISDLLHASELEKKYSSFFHSVLAYTTIMCSGSPK